MEDQQIMNCAALVISGISFVIGVMNHKRIRSGCCGKKIEVSFDIDKTTPPASAQP